MQQNDIVTGQAPEINRQTPVESRPPKKPKSRSILPTIAILVAAPLVALALTKFVFQSYEVDGPSMETTLQHQDRLLVWKMPVTWASISGSEYLPERGDVIIFKKKGLSGSGSSDKQLIKRVIGLPGDRVVVSDGKITVYNNENPDGFNPDTVHEYRGNIDGFTSGDVDQTLREGEIFVCGDNRNNSLDSRSFGPIETQDIVGDLVFRMFPVNRFKSFL